MSEKLFSFLLAIFIGFALQAQHAEIKGKIYDEKGDPLPYANVVVKGMEHIWNISDEKGTYSLKVPSDIQLEIEITAINMQRKVMSVQLTDGEVKQMDVLMKGKVFDEVLITTDRKREEISTVQIELKDVFTMPNPSGSIEAFLVAQALGVQKNNELSSAYSVRGGNFDENLVYVNDFEVYRPFLIRSGQQEGLSFVNADLVDNVSFSSGGFQAKYGDKMSSVLDVTYRRPKEFRGSASASLLGGSVHLEGADKSRRFTYATGLRSRTSRILLSSQDIKGQYAPAFLDVQSFFTYQVSEKFHFEYITNYSRNKFDFIPENRTTDFGLVNFQTRFQVFYEGQQNDNYQSFMNGLAGVYKPKNNLEFKWMASAYAMNEKERFDIIGDYFLGEVETDPSSENVGEVKYQLGSGTFHDWARNELITNVYNGAFKGAWFSGNHSVRFGVDYKREIIRDKLNEWERLDSAGYSLPFSETEVLIFDVFKAEPFDLSSNRFSAFFQDTWHIGGDSGIVSINYGARIQYWDVNNEWVVSPRAQFSFRPGLKRDIVFTAASGLYQQPPFYREMRNQSGQVNLDLRAQKSAHFLVGMDYAFTAWNTPFRFITEAYYKYLWDIVPFKYENVLIRYFGTNNSKGYAAGIDMRLHGELAKGAESWVSLSLMRTEEDILDDFFTRYIIEKTKEEANGQIVNETMDTVSVENVFPGYIPRPTDQRVSFAVFFQDYIPKAPFLKVHMSLVFGTGLPFGPPVNTRYQDTFRIPPYRRFDIGFSAQLYDKLRKIEKGKPVKAAGDFIKQAWLSLEVFNLFGIENTVSYFWVNGLDIRTGEFGRFAVPNYLTNRRVNLRLRVDF
jgi:hypothetical protein